MALIFNIAATCLLKVTHNGQHTFKLPLVLCCCAAWQRIALIMIWPASKCTL